ncbi:hypothetical protein HDU93_002538, partial [Gonapodya sp. JEL0774]
FGDTPPKLTVHPAVDKHLLGKDCLNHLKAKFTSDHTKALHPLLKPYSFHTEVMTLQALQNLFSDVFKRAASHFCGKDQQAIINDLKAQQKNLDNADEFALLTTHLLQTTLDNLQANLKTPDGLTEDICSAVELVHGIDLTKQPASSTEKPLAVLAPSKPVNPNLAVEEPDVSPEETALDMVHQLTLALCLKRKVSKHLRMVEEALDTTVLNTLRSLVLTSDITVQRVKNVLNLLTPRQSSSHRSTARGAYLSGPALG